MDNQIKILTCGSVDDGKSTLIGNLLFENRKIYDDQIESLRKESKDNILDYALLLDGLDEEREQGITIDIAYKYFYTEKRKYIILDCPGHSEYTKNMAVGASQADIAILLIDATKGLLEQTKRHLYICSMMGIRKIIIVNLILAAM